MKLYTFTIVILMSFAVPVSEFGVSQSQLEETDGSITGVVELIPKNTPSRFGGGMYGRPSRSPSSEITVDSVLVILMGSENNTTPQNTGPVILDQKGQKFIPNLLPIRQNQDVRIRNSDPVYHNVFSLSKTKKFDVGRRPRGEYLDVTFDKPGVVDVFCDIHSNMHAVIYVIPANALHWVKIKSGETFSIDEVPPGNYELKVFASGYEEQSVAVEVGSGKITQIGTVTLNS
ncbi:MAG: hypothetical protein HUJ22_05835 [Gracilimonas sp.]|uniref:hypothetical protein n=1 Tax=Gracilimonas sp. TaxID=1974203 RepID=UPI00198BEEFF|nr:hypothetical protein [Gracilimonas sp.]MBD3616076.1 hypothetical protein [Gracilimonas sp.]